MIEAGLVGYTAWSMVGADDCYDLAGGSVAFVEGNDDRVVAGLPHRRCRDLIHQAAHKFVALRDEPALLRGPGIARVHAPGRSAVHVVALVRHDVAEIGNRSRREIRR